MYIVHTTEVDMYIGSDISDCAFLVTYFIL